MSGCDREAIGAYLLGGLDQGEAGEVRAHLAECPSCRAEHDRLARILPLLSRVSADDIDRAGWDAPPARAETVDRPSGPNGDGRRGGDRRAERIEDDLGWRRLRARMRDERVRGRRRARAVIAAAAAAVVVMMVGSAWLGGRWVSWTMDDTGGVDVTPPPTITATAPPTSPGSTTGSYGEPLDWAGEDEYSGVAASAKLYSTGWGTKIEVALTGIDPGETCTLVAYEADGTSWDAGSWKVPEPKDPSGGHGGYKGANWSGSVAADRSAIDRIVVYLDGEEVVELSG